MLKKSFSAFQAPLPPCDINNTNKNNSRVHTSNRLSDRDPNTLAQCVLCRGELFFSPLPQPAVGWDVAAVSAWLHTGHWDEKWENFTMSCRNSEDLNPNQKLIKT